MDNLATYIIGNDLLKYVDFSYECWDRFITNNGVRNLLWNKYSVIDFVREFTGRQHLERNDFKAVTDYVHSRIERLSKVCGAPIIQLNELPDKNPDKQAIVSKILNKRKKEGFGTGPVCILKDLEWSRSWNLTKRYGFEIKPRRVYQYYIYVQDKLFGGPGYFKINTYLPLQIEGYFNQHNWAQMYLDREGIDYRMYYNSFQNVGMDQEEFQKILDRLSFQDIKNYNLRWIKRVFPEWFKQYDVFMKQTEFCSNIHFRDRKFLREWYTQYSIKNWEAGRPDNLSFVFNLKRFLEKGEIKFRSYEGVPSEKVQHKSNQIKGYVKGCNLRIESTVNNPRDINCSKQDYAEVRDESREMNRRFHTVREGVDANWVAGTLTTNPFLSKTSSNGKKRFPKVDLTDDRIIAAMKVFMQEKYAVNGLMNKDVREFIGYESGDVKYNAQMANYDIRKLREHGIVEKESGHNRYHLTGFGRMFVKAFTVLDEKVIKPFVKRADSIAGEVKKTAEKTKKDLTGNFHKLLHKRYMNLEKAMIELLQFTGIDVFV